MTARWLGDRVAIVAGASRGIGREIAVTLARSGAHVAGVARSSDALADLGGEIEGLGRRFLPVTADVTKVEALPELIAEVESWGGPTPS